jgi:hypothetical protein
MSIEPNLTAGPVVPAMIVADLSGDPAQAGLQERVREGRFVLDSSAAALIWTRV